MSARILSKLNFAIVLLMSFTSFAQSVRPLVQAEISRLADTAHLEFKGQKSWKYELLKQGANKFTLTIPPIDAASLGRLKSFTDPLIKSVEVATGGPDGSHVITFTTADSGVDSFDYLTDEPSRLIIDFYRKPSIEEKKVQVPPAPTVEKKTAAKVSKKKAAIKDAQYQDVARNRKPAGDEFLNIASNEEKGDLSLRMGIFDGADENYDRFRIKDYEIKEEAIIAARYNIYLKFPMLNMKVSQLDRLLEERPEFMIKPKESRENKEARLLMTLFERKRTAVFIKTFEYFRGKYPESEYLEIIKNVAAHVYLERWRSSKSTTDFERAKELLTELIKKYPESPLREYNHQLLAYAHLEHGDNLATLQVVQQYIKEFPKSSDIPQMRKALAEAYMNLAKFDEASSEYNKIIKDYPQTEPALEAFYRLGDVSFSKGDFNQAIKQYEAALKQYPDSEKKFPNANFNMAEARFWQKEYKPALNDYVSFVNHFPSHDYGGYALTRIGELLGIMGADQRRAMGAFLESYFRFAGEPGAKVARIRMLSQQMRGMKSKELKKSIDEMAEIAKNLEIPGVQEFTTLLKAEGLSARGDYTDALKELVSYYQENPLSVNHDLFRARILKNISWQMKEQVDQGDFIKTLKFYNQYADNWLKTSDRIDVPYLVGSAYERAGAFTEAQKYYESVLARRKRIVGTADEKERKAQEQLPSVQAILLRLASTQAQERKYIDAYQSLKEIGAGNTLSPAETIERVQLTALIAEQKNEPGKAKDALLELANKWQGDEALLAPVNLQLARTYMKLGEPKEAQVFAEKALAAESEENKIPPKVIADAMNVRADALYSQKKPIAAVEMYQKLLERFETSMPLGNVRYRVGQILFDRGDLKGAADAWQRLEGTPQEFLWKIGKEKLADAQWRDEYSKYTGRIPAMANQEDKK